MNITAKHLLTSMSFIGEDLIEEAASPVKRNHFLPVAGSLIAAMLLLVFLTLPKQIPISHPLPADPVIPDEPNEIHINWLEDDPTALQGALKLDIDVEIMTHLIPDEETRIKWSWLVPGIRGLDQEAAKQLSEEKAVWETLMAEFSAAAGTDGDQLIKALEEKFEITDFYTRLVRTEKDGPYEQIHDYCLNLESESGGTAAIAISAVAKPLRCYLIHDDGPLVSRIGETELIINGCEVNGKTLYLAQFTQEFSQDIDSDTPARGCIWYDVETQDFTIDELEMLLELLLHNYSA